MKKQNATNSFAFKKAAVTELNSNELTQVIGGLSRPVFEAAMNQVIQHLEELKEKAQQAQQAQ